MSEEAEGRADGEGWFVSAQAKVGSALFSALRDAQRQNGIKRGQVYGKSDKTASAPDEKPVHPTQLLANIYHSFGIAPDTIVYNHLNQPRELVKAEPVHGLYA